MNFIIATSVGVMIFVPTSISSKSCCAKKSRTARKTLFNTLMAYSYINTPRESKFLSPKNQKVKQSIIFLIYPVTYATI